MLSAPKDRSDNGYLVKTGVRPMPESDPITDPPSELLPDSSLEYLDKMVALCKENDAELVLIKAPTNSRGYWWYDEWDEQIVEYSAKNGIDYYNFIPYADDMGIDWQTDTYDGGLHLNAYGAEKFTEYFGEILLKEYGLTSHKDDTAVAERWDNYLKEYKTVKKEMEENS